MITFIKKNWSNLLFVIFFILILIPQTRMPIQVFFQRLISFSPTEIALQDQTKLENYFWPMQNLNGANVNLETEKGNVVLINKWATWCPPCVAEMPSLQKLYKNYGDKVSFYFVTNEQPEKVKAFMEKNNYTFPVYLSKTVAPELLNSNSLPTTYIISKDSNIAMQKIGAADWNSDAVYITLNKLLEN